MSNVALSSNQEMPDLATAGTYQDNIGAAVDRLVLSERRLLGLIATMRDEEGVSVLATVLDDLARARMLIECPSGRDNRGSSRVHERIATLMVLEDGRAVDVAILDISSGGALVECDVIVATAAPVRLIFPGLDDELAAHVRSRDGSRLHLEFDKLQPKRRLALVKRIESHLSRY